MRRVVVVLAALVAVMSTVIAPASAATVSRTGLINRAASWLTANNGGPVPYSQERNWVDGYPTDEYTTRIEPRGTGGTTYRALTYGLFGHDQYKARRLKNISGW
jgi:hypothetical protein